MSDTCSEIQLKRLPTLLDMPLDVVELILEKMEPHLLLLIRKVNQSLRRAVENFEISSDHIGLFLADKEIRTRLEVKNYGKYIRYKEVDDSTSNGTVLKYNDVEQCHIEEENFMEMGFNDLKILWKNISDLIICNETDQRYDIIKHFIDSVKVRKPAHVKEASLSSFSLDNVHDILSHFDSQTLEHINIWNIKPQFERDSGQLQRIADLNQWKNAKIFRLQGYTFGSEVLHYLFHFESFEVDMITVFSTKTAIQIRDDLMRRSAFQHCKIRSNTHTDPIQIAKVFEPEFAGGNILSTEYKHSNDNNIFYVHFQLNSSSLLFYVKKTYAPMIFITSKIISILSTLNRAFFFCNFMLTISNHIIMLL